MASSSVNRVSETELPRKCLLVDFKALRSNFDSGYGNSDKFPFKIPVPGAEISQPKQDPNFLQKLARFDSKEEKTWVLLVTQAEYSSTEPHVEFLALTDKEIKEWAKQSFQLQVSSKKDAFKKSGVFIGLAEQFDTRSNVYNYTSAFQGFTNEQTSLTQIYRSWMKEQSNAVLRIGRSAWIFYSSMNSIFNKANKLISSKDEAIKNLLTRLTKWQLTEHCADVIEAKSKIFTGLQHQNIGIWIQNQRSLAQFCHSLALRILTPKDEKKPFDEIKALNFETMGTMQDYLYNSLLPLCFIGSENASKMGIVVCMGSLGYNGNFSTNTFKRGEWISSILEFKGFNSDSTISVSVYNAGVVKGVDILDAQKNIKDDKQSFIINVPTDPQERRLIFVTTRDLAMVGKTSDPIDEMRKQILPRFEPPSYDEFNTSDKVNAYCGLIWAGLDYVIIQSTAFNAANKIAEGVNSGRQSAVPIVSSRDKIDQEAKDTERKKEEKATREKRALQEKAREEQALQEEKARAEQALQEEEEKEARRQKEEEELLATHARELQEAQALNARQMAKDKANSDRGKSPVSISSPIVVKKEKDVRGQSPSPFVGRARASPSVSAERFGQGSITGRSVSPDIGRTLGFGGATSPSPSPSPGRGGSGLGRSSSPAASAAASSGASSFSLSSSQNKQARASRISADRAIVDQHDVILESSRNRSPSIPRSAPGKGAGHLSPSVSPHPTRTSAANRASVSRSPSLATGPVAKTQVEVKTSSDASPSGENKDAVNFNITTKDWPIFKTNDYKLFAEQKLKTQVTIPIYDDNDEVVPDRFEWIVRPDVTVGRQTASTYWDENSTPYLYHLTKTWDGLAKDQDVNDMAGKNKLIGMVKRFNTYVPTLWPPALHWRQSWFISHLDKNGKETFAFINAEKQNVVTAEKQRSLLFNEIIIETACKLWAESKPDISNPPSAEHVENVQRQLDNEISRVKKLILTVKGPSLKGAANNKPPYSNGFKDIVDLTEGKEAGRFFWDAMKENQGSVFVVVRGTIGKSTNPEMTPEKQAELKEFWVPTFFPEGAKKMKYNAPIEAQPTAGLTEREFAAEEQVDEDWQREWDITLKLVDAANEDRVSSGESKNIQPQSEIQPLTFVQSFIDGEKRPAHVLVHFPGDDSVFVLEPQRAVGVHRVPLAKLKLMTNSSDPYDRSLALLNSGATLEDVEPVMENIFMWRKYHPIYEWMLSPEGNRDIRT